MPYNDDGLIHITIPTSGRDPRDPAPELEGVVIHHAPEFHPDDIEILPNGLRLTSPSRTLVDLAEVMSKEELRATFARAREIDLLDLCEVRASMDRVEWRPSLGMLREVIAEFEAA